MVEEAVYVTSKNEQAKAAQSGTTDSMDTIQLTQGEPVLPVAKKRKLNSLIHSDIH